MFLTTASIPFVVLALVIAAAIFVLFRQVGALRSEFGTLSKRVRCDDAANAAEADAAETIVFETLSEDPAQQQPQQPTSPPPQARPRGGGILKKPVAALES